MHTMKRRPSQLWGDAAQQTFDETRSAPGVLACPKSYPGSESYPGEQAKSHNLEPAECLGVGRVLETRELLQGRRVDQNIQRHDQSKCAGVEDPLHYPNRHL